MRTNRPLHFRDAAFPEGCAGRSGVCRYHEDWSALLSFITKLKLTK